MKTVKQLMVSFEDYTNVPEDASLLDAVTALEKAQQLPEVDPSRPRDRAVMVIGKNNKAIGKLSMWDVLRGLEPRYNHPIDPLSMAADFGFWHPLRNLAEKASSVKARDLVRIPEEGERIDEEASLDQAVSQLLGGKHLSLLVTRAGEIIGILRLSDVFREVGTMIKSAGTASATT
jgi:CBS domain-containing protein